MASAAVSPKPSRKFVKENSELKKRCKELEDKLAEMVTRSNSYKREEKDKEIAGSVPHLDVVVGAHTHSFLFSPTEDHPIPSNNEHSADGAITSTALLLRVPCPSLRGQRRVAELPLHRRMGLVWI